MSSDRITVLNTIYDNVLEFKPGYYAIELQKNYGVASDSGKIYVDPSYKKAYYRDNYIVFIGEKSKVVFINTGKEAEFTGDISLTVKNESFCGIKEHSGLNYEVIEIAYADEDDNGITRADYFNTLTGEVIGTRDSTKPATYRPYNNGIIISYIDYDTGERKGIIKEDNRYESYTILKALKEKYNNVKEIKGRSIRYECMINGESVILNQYGQEY